MKISENIQKEYAVLSIEGSLSVEQINRLENSLNVCYKSNIHVILQLAEVTFIDSSSIGLIVLYMTKFLNINKHMILVSPKREIDQMFNITGVSNHIKVFDTLNLALDFIKK